MYVYFAPLASPTILLHLVTPNLITYVLLYFFRLPTPSPHQYDDSSHLTLKESSSTKAYTTQVGRRELNKLEDAKLNFPTYLFHNLHLGLWIIRAVYKKTFFFLYQREYALRENCGTWEIISDRFTAKLKWLQPLHSISNSAAFGEVCYQIWSFNIWPFFCSEWSLWTCPWQVSVGHGSDDDIW